MKSNEHIEKWEGYFQDDFRFGWVAEYNGYILQHVMKSQGSLMCRAVLWNK